MNEENKKPTYLDKLSSLATGYAAGELWRALRGVAQISAAVSFGPIGTALSFISFSSLSLVKHRLFMKQAKKNLLELYSQEVATITNKPVKSLTIKDLDVAASYRPEGKKNAVAMELEALNKNNKINLTASMISIVTIGALAAFSATAIAATAFATGAGFVFPASAFALASAAVFMTADHFVSLKNGGRENYNFNAKLKELVKYNQFQKIEPEQVFDLLLKTNPVVEAEIKNKYSKSYAVLPLSVKTAIVDSYEEKFHAKHFADMINKGEMRAQELGFAAYGGSSGIKVTAPTLEKAPLDESVSLASNHVDRLNMQRMKESESRTIH